MKNNVNPNFTPSIFKNNIGLNSKNISGQKKNKMRKLLDPRLEKNKVGTTNYFSPFSKEWNNTIYTYNSNITKFLPININNINFLIKSYFNMYFNFFNTKIQNLKINSFNKIFVSKPELKFTNKEVIITVFTHNREKLILLKKMAKLKKSLLKKLTILTIKTIHVFEDVNSFLDASTTSKKFIKTYLSKELMKIQKLKTKFNVNKYKYQDVFLIKLSKLISPIYKKKILFNIVNLKSFTYNSDFFTEMITLKLKDRKARIMNILRFISKNILLPKINKNLEKFDKSVNLNLLENKHKNLYLNSILNANHINFDDNLKELYSDCKHNNISNTIFNKINYKNMGGIKLVIKGRLTKRFKADKSISKKLLIGGLQNPDSSYRGLSSYNMRGYLKSNVQYTLLESKRPIGSFAAKGWLSGT